MFEIVAENWMYILLSNAQIDFHYQLSLACKADERERKRENSYKGLQARMISYHKGEYKLI